MTTASNPPPRSHAVWVALTRCLFMLGLYVLATPTALSVNAQTTAPATETPRYWRHDAPGQVSHSFAHDLDGNGFDEFGLVSAETTLQLFRSDGSPLWDEPFEANAPIIAIHPFGEHIAWASEFGLHVIGLDQTERWSRSLSPSTIVRHITAVDDNLIVLFSNGLLQRFSASGSILWDYKHIDVPADIASAQLLPYSADGSSATEQSTLLFSYATLRGFSRVDLVETETGRNLWTVPINRLVTSLTPIQFETDQPPRLAVGNNIGEVHLLDFNKTQQWHPRTLNKPITALSELSWPDVGTLLLVGTDVGKLVAYNQAGERIWDQTVCPNDNTLVLQSAPCLGGPAGSIRRIEYPQRDDGNLAFVLQFVRGNGSAELLLVDHQLNVIARYPAADLRNVPLLVDSNGDGREELLLTAFGSLELVSGSTSARSTSDNWFYQLAAKPNAVLTADLNHDGVDELLVGATDGRLHHLTAATGGANWIAFQADSSIIKLAQLKSPRSADGAPRGADHVLVAHNQTIVAGAGVPEQRRSQLALRGADGNEVWLEPISDSGHIRTLLVDQSADPTATNALVLIGLDNGNIQAYRLQHTNTSNAQNEWSITFVWQRTLPSGITSGTLLQQPNESRPSYLFSTRNTIDQFNQAGTQVYTVPINEASPLCDSPAELLYLVANGGVPQQVCLLNRRLRDWSARLGRPLIEPQQTTGSYLYRPMGETELQRIGKVDVAALLGDDATDRNVFQGEPTIFDNVGAWHIADMTGNGILDVVIGQSDGTVTLDLNEARDTIVEFPGSVHSVTTLHSADSEPAELVVITENGLVNLLAFTPNFPPFLTEPRVNALGEQFEIEINVLDVEADEIIVELEHYDSLSGEWVSAGTERSQGSADTLRWTINHSADGEPLQYRFDYTDNQFHSGRVTAPAGPTLPPPSRLWLQTSVLAALALSILSGMVWWRRQSRRPSARAYRFMSELRQTPSLLLINLRSRFNSPEDGTEFFINLAAAARQNDYPFLASLADGLYLLSDRPAAGLDIINSTLSELQPEQDDQALLRLSDWRILFNSAKQLFNAPTITELSLLRPMLAPLLEATQRDVTGHNPYIELGDIFNSLRDSERVDTVEDRLTYLGDADSQLRQLDQQLAKQLEQRPTLNLVVLNAIVTRWRGLVTAAAESLRGRTRIEVLLKTKRLASAENSQLVLEIINTGRASAEEIRVVLRAGDVEPIKGAERIIPLLTSSRRRTVSFPITLPETQPSFRVVFKVSFRDRQQKVRTFDYADQISVLAPRDFRPIPNPYSPGTPLRRNSDLFFGREALFQFVAAEAERISQQHVLILVGQRRTGKTSALLRLSQHLPNHLIPVYVDCQSLGVLPGMRALFQDLAWLIADTLEEHDIYYDVPDLDDTGGNPGHWFQHTFIPDVREHLLPNARILLVFDEFEALENLVNDNILPRTIFSYLRHLMQHGEGLSFIFVGTHRLEEMTTDYWSVLFNIALYSEISYLNPSAAERLISEPVKSALVYDDLAIDKIWRLTAGHPYFLQLVCYSLVKRANARRVGYVTITDVNETVEEMIGLGEVHFAYIWQRSSQAERIVLIAVAHLIDKDLPFRPADVVQAIETYKIELSPAEVTAALNRLVQRSIMHEINEEANTLYELRLGLVDIWVERTRSLSKLYSGRRSS